MNASPFLLAVVVVLSGCSPSHAPTARVAVAAPPSPPLPPASAEGRALLKAAADDYRRGEREASYAEAARAAELLTPADDLWTASALQLAGHGALAHGNCARAAAAYERSLAIRERLLGSTDAMVGLSAGSLAEARRCAGNDEAAVGLFQRSHDILAAIPSRLAERVDMACRLAPILERRGDSARAEALLRDAIGTVDAARGRGDPLYFRLLAPLDSALRRRHDDEGAARLWARIPVGDYCAPEPCSAAPPAESPVAPAPERTAPPASKPAVMRGGMVSNAARVVASLRSAFRACYNDGLRRDGRMFGRVELHMQVDATGAVSAITAHRIGHLDDAAVRCVLEVARAPRFDPPEGGRATINVPVTFVLDRPGR